MVDNRPLKFERMLGGLKFGVTLILLFALASTVGTFLESYYGTEFAGRVMYKHPLFMLLQLCMFVCIFYATMLRLPFKKRLAGFYVLHAGLLMLFIGSFITYRVGVDGQVTLPPKTTTNQVVLSEDELVVNIESTSGDKSSYTFDLPTSAFATSINKSWKDIKLGRYYPYSESSLFWANSQPDMQGSSYRISNDNVSENFTLTLDSESDYPSNTKMGPLSVHYMPGAIGKCFGSNGSSGYIIWNLKQKTCFTPEQRNIKSMQTQNGNQFLAFKEGDEIIKFFPDFSPMPLDDDFNPVFKHNYRIFSQKLFQKGAQLFLFGESLAFYDRDEQRWYRKQFQSEGDIIDLPWMGFEIKLTEHHRGKSPYQLPYYVTPIQKNNEIIKGSKRALEIEVRGQKYWLKTGKTLSLMIDGQKYEMFLGKKTLQLPFELTLNRFKMDKDPGTNNPASYESFVKLFDGDQMKEHHIYMNNPLKYDQLTFYQASYFPLEGGGHGSVLSVNYDPGRPLKYLGSLLLVLGSIWHFFLRSRLQKNKKNSNREALA
jgi:hypothetical protein